MQPSREERILAALSHASILANGLSFAGILVTTLVWILRRERSEYVRIQSSQALAYQIASFGIGLVMLLVWSACTGLTLTPLIFRPDLYTLDDPPVLFTISLFALCIPAIFIIACMVYGVVAAYSCYQGKNFKYIGIGHWFEQQEEETPASPIAQATSTVQAPEQASPIVPASEPSPSSQSAEQIPPVAATSDANTSTNVSEPEQSTSQKAVVNEEISEAKANNQQE